MKLKLIDEPRILEVSTSGKLGGRWSIGACLYRDASAQDDQRD